MHPEEEGQGVFPQIMAGFSLVMPNSCFLPHLGGAPTRPSSIVAPSLRFPVVGMPPPGCQHKMKALSYLQFCLQAGIGDGIEQDGDDFVEELRIPSQWLVPSKALEESEWLRVTLHKWLDDEYCPEAANVEISRCAARSYHNSLMKKQTDLGEILLKMARDLESISFQESFHGAFSSANAAIHLIIQRIELVKQQ